VHCIMIAQPCCWSHPLQNPLLDQHNCGKCGQHCNHPAECKNGKCICPTGQHMCKGYCKDLTKDRNHCGQCDNLCTPGIGCNSGVCTNEVKCPSGQHKCGHKYVVSGSWANGFQVFESDTVLTIQCIVE
jgi:hypothetical protein